MFHYILLQNSSGRKVSFSRESLQDKEKNHHISFGLMPEENKALNSRFTFINRNDNLNGKANYLLPFTFRQLPVIF